MSEIRPIDANELKDSIVENIRQLGDQCSPVMLTMFGLFSDIIDNAPTVEPQKAVTIPHELIEKLVLCVVDTVENIDWNKAIEAYKARPQGEWIAVKDKFPDTDGCYLVSLENGQIVVAHSSGIIENHDFEPRMLAWQPLPEPYKAGGKEE